MTKQWTTKWHYVANAVFRIVQNHGESSHFRRLWGGGAIVPIALWIRPVVQEHNGLSPGMQLNWCLRKFTNEFDREQSIRSQQVQRHTMKLRVFSFYLGPVTTGACSIARKESHGVMFGGKFCLRIVRLTTTCIRNRYSAWMATTIKKNSFKNQIFVDFLVKLPCRRQAQRKDGVRNA